jgi:hypothetical protein
MPAARSPGTIARLAAMLSDTAIFDPAAAPSPKSFVKPHSDLRAILRGRAPRGQRLVCKVPFGGPPMPASHAVIREPPINDT